MVTDKLLRELLAEVHAIRRAVERRQVDRAGELAEALREFFGSAPFTAAGIVEAAGDDGGLFDAVSPLVDLDGDRPAVHLGRVLARLAEVERVGDRRGVGLFRLRG